ncbi:copper ion binding protein [Anaerocolumna sp. AGMB13025]|uniref:heavy-metal-associated domain-containing protein n=1 Tax=Anaerocolumna sp. AGMB13025 TaxID=3039116 RepID=UPI00241BFB82|nr:copper ion binding protein [Anaerocolumna sp. AGMB13025]WFR59735.1 copper ion binding protein [Anaerocolumna sp. AGMB13025]
MKKILKIEGMTCSHCQARVEKALNGISGVNAKVDLKKKAAVVSFDSDVSDAVFKDAVTEAGYEVVSIEEKKGLFSR